MADCSMIDGHIDRLDVKRCTCGSAPLMADVGGYQPTYEICCSKCDKVAYGTTEAEAIEEWNRRNKND